MFQIASRNLATDAFRYPRSQHRICLRDDDICNENHRNIRTKNFSIHRSTNINYNHELLIIITLFQTNNICV